MNFESLTAETIAQQSQRGILILPVGTVEQHGPHLPLTVDTEIPLHIASRLTETMKGFVAPAIFYGAGSLPQSGGSPDIPGTIRIRGSVLTEYLKDVIGGYAAMGFRSIVILNGHYENESFLFEALEQCRQERRLEGAKVVALSWWSVVPQTLLDKLFGAQFQGWHTEHASACETSLMLHLRKELVGQQRVDHKTPPRSGIYLFPVEAFKASNRGVLGTTSNASAEIGRTLFEEICSQLLALVREHMGPDAD